VREKEAQSHLSGVSSRPRRPTCVDARTTTRSIPSNPHSASRRCDCVCGIFCVRQLCIFVVKSFLWELFRFRFPSMPETFAINVFGMKEMMNFAYGSASSLLSHAASPAKTLFPLPCLQ
jgi:hypothetical protein